MLWKMAADVVNGIPGHVRVALPLRASRSHGTSLSDNLVVMVARHQVWKYAIEEGPFVLRPPGQGRVVHVGVDPNGAPSIWLVVEVDAEPVERRFRTYETGEPISNSERLAYCGSYVDARRGFVGHVFEEDSERMEPVVSFIYQLLRNHLPAGVVSRLVSRSVEPGMGDADPELEIIARRYAALLAGDPS